jgi:hypothetical protein
MISPAGKIPWRVDNANYNALQAVLLKCPLILRSASLYESKF